MLVNLKDSLRILVFWDFPAGPVVKTPGFHCRGQRLISGQELRSHVSCGVAKKNETQNLSVLLEIYIV